MGFEPLFSSASAIATAIREGAISSRETVETHLDQIRRCNPKINAIATVDEEGALKRAQEADIALAQGNLRGSLHGVPVTLKDSIETLRLRTTMGSPLFANHIPAKDSEVAARLKAAGAIIIGKSNISEALKDWQTENPLFGLTRNPWNLERTAGGSSGGAAAAVASGMIPFDLGSDMGGSIRIPAHFCGVWGLKPTEGRVPESGQLWPAAMSPEVSILNTIGPLARSGDDLRLVFDVLAGMSEKIEKVNLKSLKIAWVSSLADEPAAGDISKAIENFVLQFKSAVNRAETPPLPADLEAQWTLRETIRDLIKEGRPVGLELLKRRVELIAKWEKFFITWDAFLLPPAVSTAFAHCLPDTPQRVDGRTVEYRRLFFYSTIFNLTGHPAVVFPIGVDREGLPIGAQLVGPRGGDEKLLAIAAELAKVIGPFRRPPGF